MSPALTTAFASLPDFLGWHILLSACALALGVALSLPLAVVATRSPRLRWIVLAVAGLVQTIPSLALLALFYPLLLVLAALSESIFGFGFSALGFLPSLLALTIYSMLPILRTTVTGILGVDPAVRQAADGVGMTPNQRLLQVELPLAMPVIMAGVRTAAVWTIGAATLSTPVGQTSLGNYIFSGLQTENWVSVLFGCAASAALAMTVDFLLGLIETGAANRDRPRAIAGWLGLALGVVLGVAPLIKFGQPDSYAIGTKSFSEQYVLGEVMGARLTKLGAQVTRKDDLGSAVIYRALASGEIDVYVDYTGTLWTNVLKRQDNPGRAQILATLTRELKARDGVIVLGSLGFENAYTFAMKGDQARALGVTSLADLAREAPNLTMGSDTEFLSRPEWRAVDAAYGFKFKRQRSFQPVFMYRALTGGEADVISAFSSDGRIAADKLTVLTDPKGALPPYDAVIMISPKRANDPRLLKALKPLVGSISVEAMRAANLSVDQEVGKISPAEAAKTLAP
jgi:osmoprotectant transport system permease protein